MAQMAIRQLNMLTPRQVASAKDGWHADGGNLYLRVSGEGRRRSWIFRFTRAGKVTEIGLGAADAVTLAFVRSERKRLAETVAEGRNPLAERRRTQAEEAAKRTFGEVAAYVIDRDRGHWGASTLRAWENSLNRDAKRLADLDIARIDVENIKVVLAPIIESGEHVRARRTLRCIEAVLSCAIAHGWRSAANAADWEVFKHIMPRRPKANWRHPMAPWREAPAAFARMREVPAMPTRCIEFIASTAVRLTEARSARWSEINFEMSTWTIPAERMKRAA
jgi:hypothetical protein